MKFKIVFIFAVISVLLIISVVSIWVIFKKEDPLIREGLLSKAYAVWAMDDGVGDKIKDMKSTHDAISVNTVTIEGHFSNARYFNGKDSYIKTPVNFKGWKSVAISLWVKPEKKDNNELSVILDNGHNESSNFVIQNADMNNLNSGRWVFHCAGADIFLTIPFNRWAHIEIIVDVIIADGERSKIQGYVDGVSMGEVTIGKRFKFGDAPLTIGKLAKMDARYFKGSIDDVVILRDNVVTQR